MTANWLRGRTVGANKTARIDTTHAYPARRSDYWLGGKDNFAAGRDAGQQAVAPGPPSPAEVAAWCGAAVKT